MWASDASDPSELGNGSSFLELILETESEVIGWVVWGWVASLWELSLSWEVVAARDADDRGGTSVLSMGSPLVVESVLVVDAAGDHTLLWSELVGRERRRDTAVDDFVTTVVALIEPLETFGLWCVVDV